ncbi:MAG: hypothetical protein ACOYJD_09010 [Christensenellales bacterium]|jgi:hypothetical protein
MKKVLFYLLLLVSLLSFGCTPKIRPVDSVAPHAAAPSSAATDDQALKPEWTAAEQLIHKMREDVSLSRGAYDAIHEAYIDIFYPGIQSSYFDPAILDRLVELNAPLESFLAYILGAKELDSDRGLVRYELIIDRVERYPPQGNNCR